MHVFKLESRNASLRCSKHTTHTSGLSSNSSGLCTAMEIAEGNFWEMHKDVFGGRQDQRTNYVDKDGLGFRECRNESKMLTSGSVFEVSVLNI